MTDRAASITAYWDAAAAAFDDEPDHGLRADSTRAAWRRLLRTLMPAEPVDVLDIGSGTGTMSLLLAEAGHRPTGVDLAPRMVEQARTKFGAPALPAVSWSVTPWRHRPGNSGSMSCCRGIWSGRCPTRRPPCATG